MATLSPSSPAAALQVLSTHKYVSSLEEMEAFVVSGRSGFTLFVNYETSLSEASYIKRRTGPPAEGGVSVGNPELLEGKKDAELGVKYGLNLMRAWEKEIRGHIKDTDVLIASIQQKVDADYDAMPHLGPPHRKRNWVKDRCFYAGNAPIPSLVEEPSFKKIKLETIDLTASRAADVGAQKAYWRFNVSLLQEKKKLLENLCGSIQESVSHLCAEALDEKGFLGEGYAEYNPQFLLMR